MAEKTEKHDPTRSPEFQAAVDAAVNASLGPAVQAAVSQALAALKTSAPSSAEDLFSKMALSIAEMSHQGSGRAKPIAPEVMAARQKAADQLDALMHEMSENLRAAQIGQDKALFEAWTPRYRVVGKVWLKERLIEPFRRGRERGSRPVPQDIAWSGPPNHLLKPLNEIAGRLHNLFLASVGSVARLGRVSYKDAAGRGASVQADNRPYWMTPGGLVVQGDPPAVRGDAKAMLLGQDDQVFSLDRDEPIERDNNDPTNELIHVLGTVAAPARATQFPT
jgi:hypothetical protein